MSMMMKVPVEALTEGQAAEELVRLVSESSHAGAEEQVLTIGERGHQHQQESHQECHLDTVII